MKIVTETSSFNFLPDSTANGEMINFKKAVEVGKVMQTKLDNQVPSSPIETKNKGKYTRLLTSLLGSGIEKMEDN